MTDTDFLWQVQCFRCLREVLCDPTSFLCGRCNIFVSSEQFFVALRSFCVAGAIFSMPPRSSFVTRAQGSLVTPPPFLRGRCNLFDASEKFSVTLRKVACDPSAFLCGRCNIFDGSEKFPVTLLPFCVAGAIFSCPPRIFSWPYVLFVWQVQYFRCTSFCVAGAIREVPVTLRKVACGPKTPVPTLKPQSPQLYPKGWLYI